MNGKTLMVIVYAATVVAAWTLLSGLAEQTCTTPTTCDMGLKLFVPLAVLWWALFAGRFVLVGVVE